MKHHLKRVVGEHTLTFEELSTVLLPDADLPVLPENRLNRFQLLQRIRNNFWKRWSAEYLLHLQELEKWRDPCENFAVGQLVMVKDDRYPISNSRLDTSYYTYLQI